MPDGATIKLFGLQLRKAVERIDNKQWTLVLDRHVHAIALECEQHIILREIRNRDLNCVVVQCVRDNAIT